MKLEKELLETGLRKKINEEESGKYELLQKELGEKSEKLKEFNKAMAEIEKLWLSHFKSFIKTKLVLQKSDLILHIAYPL